MTQPQDTIEAQALKLPRSERAKVALHLLDSLEQEQPSASHDAIGQEWINESARRLEAYRRGEMAAFPVAEVIAELENPPE